MARKTPGIYIAIRGDYSAFETDILKAKQIAKAQGEAIAKSINNAVSAVDLTGGINKITRELKTAQNALSAGAFKGQVSGLEEIAKAAGVSSKQLEGLTNSMLKSQAAATANRAFEYLQKNAGLSTLQLAKLRAELGDTSGALSTLWTGAKSAAVPVLAVGAALGVAAKASFDATLKLDSTTAAFESITGSAKAAQEQLSFIRELSDRLGLSFLDTAQSAKSIFASAESTGLGMEKAQKAFQAVATAGTALKLTTDQMNRLNLAVSQVISKGRPMAEEMRQQIGEVLPGAMGLFANSIGATGKELDKMFQDGKTTLDQFFTFLDALQNKYEEAAQNASHSIQAELGRLKTSWDDFLVTVGDSEAFASITRGLSNALDGATGIIKESELPNAIANLFKHIDVDVSEPAKAAAQIESEIANIIASIQKMPNPMEATAKASDQLEASIRSQSITLEHWLSRLPDEGFFKGLLGTLDELTPATKAAFDELQNLIAETKQTHNFQNFSEQIAAIGKRLETEGEMTVRFRDYLEKLQEVASRGVTVQLQLEGKEKFLQGLREVWQAWRLQNDPAMATQKRWKENFDALIAGRRQAIEKETRATTDAIERVNKVYDKSSEGKKKNLQSEIDAIINERDVFAEAVKNGTRTQKEFDDYSQKSAVAIKKLREDQQKIDKAGSKSAEAAANRAAKAMNTYQEEIAKLTMSSRDFQQVKIEEKLAKIAKDAKLPAAEMEKLRKAMEQEADFKWMQDILSYADPATAAIAKENKEFEAFRRSIERLKAQDPAKYTQLMVKAETEHEKALRKAERASKEQNEHLQEKLSFYKELEEMSGAFGLSIEVQNRLLDEQMEIFRDADIPENLIQTWRQYKDLMNSHDWADGAQRAFLQYRADATDAAKGAEAAFSSLYSGMDSGFKNVWQQMLEDGKISLSSLKSLFSSFLADLIHMAITRPITVQIAGVVSSMLGTGGVAGAGASGSGGLNIGGLTNLLPDSWTSGVSGILGSTLPGTVSTLTAPGAYSAGEVLLMQTPGTTAGTVGGQAALTSSGLSLGSALGYGGWGALGYSTLGSMIGLPQSKYSGLTAGVGGALGAWGGSALASSAAMAGSSMAAGATFGSVIPVVGTAIGAIAGGLLGSLIGGKRKTHASVYGKMEDVGFSRDAGTYSDAFMSGAWYDRAGTSEAQPFADTIGKAAATTAGTILDLAAALPDEYRKSVEDQLASSTWTAGRGISGASWNFQWQKEGMAEERVQEAVTDMMAQMGQTANAAFADAGIGNIFSSLDLSTEEGLTKATNAVNSINAISTAIDQIKTPTTEAEAQAKSFVEQMDALAESVKANGLNAEYADKLIGEYRSAYIDNYIESLEKMFSPLSQIEQQAKSYKESIDGYVSALTTMGASEEQLAKVRGYSQTAIDSITGSLDAAFFPLSDVEIQTKNTMASLTAYENALKSLGATADELAKVDAARAKVQSDLLSQVNAYIETTPEIVGQAAAMNAEFDALRQAMTEAGSATADLNELEQTRVQALAAMREEYVRSFNQDLSQRFAALNGTSDAVSRAISQENELREAIKKFGEDSAQVSQLLHLQAAENVAAAQSRVDSLTAELNQLKAQAIQKEISAITEQFNAAKTLKDTWGRLSESLKKSRTDLWTSDADALGLFARRDAAQDEFNRLYKLTMSGDADAASSLAASGDALLSLLKETSVSSSEYIAGFWSVEQKLKDAENVAGKQLSEAQKSYDTLEAQLNAQQAMLDALGYNNSSLDAINAQIVTVGQQLADALANLKAAQSSAGGGGGNFTSFGSGTPGYVQSDYDWMQSVAQAKADAMNAGYTLGTGQTAGGWTASSVIQTIKDAGYSDVYDWYNKNGYDEGFRGNRFTGYALGGLTPLNEPFKVGEQGEEWMLSPSQYVVLNNSMTRKLDEMRMLSQQTRQPVIDYRIMQMPAVGTDGDTKALLVQLVEEIKALRSENQQLRVSTQRIVKATETTADYTEQNYMEAAQ